MNEILHSVTNRTLFDTPCFRTGKPFYPMSPDPQAELRTLLGLTRRDYRYFVLGVLGAVYSFPAVAAEFREAGRSFRMSDIPAPQTVFKNIAVAPSHTDAPSISRTAGLNFDPVMSFRYLDDQHLALTVDGADYPVPVVVSDLMLQLGDHVAPVDIKGQLAFSEAWAPGFEGSITFYPPFPYGPIIEAIERARLHVPLLLTSNLTDQYLFAESDMEKVAVIALAVGLSNTAVYVR